MVETNLPIIFLKEHILLPYNELRLEFVDENDKLVLNIAELCHDSHLLLINLTDPLEINPSIRELPKVGILGKIKSKIELPNGLIRVVISGLDRVEVLNYINLDNIIESFVIPTKQYPIREFEENALKKILFRDLELYIESAPYMSNSVLGRILGKTNLSTICDIISFELPINYNQKLKYIEITDPIERTKILIEDLNHELAILNLEMKIDEE